MNTQLSIKPELTAISTRHSTSSEIIAQYNNDSMTLDYGCGTGRNMEYLLSQGVTHLVGCDIPEQLAAQKVKHDKLREKGCLICKSDWLSPDNFNLILCSHVLNVIEDDQVKIAVLQDIARLLTDGGTAVIEVRTAHDVETAKTKEAYKNGWLIKKGKAFTYQEGISKAKMTMLCRSAGLKIESHVCNSSKHIVIVTK